MQLNEGFVFKPLPEIGSPVHRPFPGIDHPLGPLRDLPGTWTGTGFNTIWRPMFGSPDIKKQHFLELNLTTETIQFEIIPGKIPNRGLLQHDINMFGVTYLQQISDAVVGAGLHIEPGIWAAVPSTLDPKEDASVVRMASIPHGTTIMAQGFGRSGTALPAIPDNNITPFVIGTPNLIPFPETNLAIASVQRSAPAQIVGITQAMVDNPNSVLKAAIAGQTIARTTMLKVSSNTALPLLGGGTDNTAFLQGTTSAGPNAQAAIVDATFWIEHVTGQHGQPDFLQLQYSQVVQLNFNGLSWPHVTVGTLKKAPGAEVDGGKVDPAVTTH